MHECLSHVRDHSPSCVSAHVSPRWLFPSSVTCLTSPHSSACFISQTHQLPPAPPAFCGLPFLVNTESSLAHTLPSLSPNNLLYFYTNTSHTLGRELRHSMFNVMQINMNLFMVQFTVLYYTILYCDTFHSNSGGRLV